MRHFLRLLSAGLTLAALVGARPAEACGPLPTPYFTLGETVPKDGATGVALDAPLLVAGTPWPNIPGTSLAQVLQVEVKPAGGGAAVSGQTDQFGGRATWNPISPLSASTTYEVKLHVANVTGPSTGDSGPVDKTFSFTTGTALLPPLALASEPSYAFETRDFPYCPPEEQNDCGGCAQMHTKPGLAVVVTPPKIEGGAAESGYWVVARLESGEGVPHGTVNLSAALPQDGSASTIVIPVPTEAAPYEPCLHVEAMDATGKMQKSATKCFPKETTGGGSGGAAGAAGSGGAAGAGGSASGGQAGSPQAAGSGGSAQAAAGVDPVAEGGDSSGCSASGRGASGGLGLLASVGAALAVARRRRSAARR